MGVIDLDARVRKLEQGGGGGAEIDQIEAALTALEEQINGDGETDLGLAGDVSDLEDAVEVLQTHSTTKRAVGTWIDGKTVYEKTYVFDYEDFHGQTIDGTVQKGQLWLDIPATYSTMWIDYSASFLFNTVSSGTAVKSHPLNFYSTGGVYTRANLQRTDSSNEGLPFVYYENTYSASAWYSNISEWRWIITVRWTEVTV